ncbi:MAG: ABC transporter ATP-binding protein [Pirellula sp.]|jgi:ABC-2 type transport system ATP-binding protein|nr:ABC transporter ATP-binding protein [Pirellula sp.]
MQPILEIQGVTKRYGGQTALRDVTLALPPGIVGLLGPNGSGKSTLIKALLGLVAVDAGNGRVLDYRWPDEARILRDHVGYLPEDDCYIEGLQGIESIQMMARLSGLKRTEALRRAHEVADFCDMGQERYRTVDTYSTGMRQKLKFAQALVHDPKWLILDEPTTGLDPAQREQLLDRIAVLAHEKGKSILLSTHILHDVQRVCDWVVILVGGQVRVVDSLENLQRPSQAGFQVSVVSDTEILQSKIAEHGISVSRLGAGDLRVDGEGDHVLQAVWQASRESGVLIQRVDRFRNSLEQTFLDAVVSTEGVHAHS